MATMNEVSGDCVQRTAALSNATTARPIRAAKSQEIIVR